jgi:hypothetical protein
MFYINEETTSVGNWMEKCTLLVGILIGTFIMENGTDIFKEIRNRTSI